VLAGLAVAQPCAAYVTYLLMDSTGYAALPRYSTVMLVFVLPITALTLIVLATYEPGLLRGRREAARDGWLSPARLRGSAAGSGGRVAFGARHREGS
jgi:hypothetical protein